MAKEHTKWAKIVGQKIEEQIKSEYGNAWRQFGRELKSDIIHGRIMYALLQMERFAHGWGLAAGEIEARVQAIRDYIMPRINPEY